MIKFGYKEYEREYPEWSKHYPYVGACLKRVYSNGEVILPEDEKAKRLAEEYESELVAKPIQLWSDKERKLIPATDYYLILKNREYEEVDVPYYSIGAMNTEQTIYYRLKFQLEECFFCLAHTFKASGTFAMAFSDLLDSSFISNVIGEILEQGLPLEKSGIEKIDNGYRIVVVDCKSKEPIDIEIELHELEKGLIGAEVYKFEQTITD